MDTGTIVLTAVHVVASRYSIGMYTQYMGQEALNTGVQYLMGPQLDNTIQ